MFDIGFSELSLIFILALLVFGPDKLPELVRTVEQLTARIRLISQDLKQKMEDELMIQDLDKTVQRELSNSGLLDSDDAIDAKIQKNKGRFLKDYHHNPK